MFWKEEKQRRRKKNSLSITLFIFYYWCRLIWISSLLLVQQDEHNYLFNKWEFNIDELVLVNILQGKRLSFQRRTNENVLFSSPCWVHTLEYHGGLRLDVASKNCSMKSHFILTLDWFSLDRWTSVLPSRRQINVVKRKTTIKLQLLLDSIILQVNLKIVKIFRWRRPVENPSTIRKWPPAFW